MVFVWAIVCIAAGVLDLGHASSGDCNFSPTMNDSVVHIESLVRIMYGDKPLDCMGTIITNNWILVPASCITNIANAAYYKIKLTNGFVYSAKHVSVCQVSNWNANPFHLVLDCCISFVQQRAWCWLRCGLAQSGLQFATGLCLRSHTDRQLSEQQLQAD